MSIPTRAVIDVGRLPDTNFGDRDLAWWGTLGFVVIEGFTLCWCAVVYVYLSRNTHVWPPFGTPLPSLLAPTLQLAVMALSIPFVHRLKQAARRFDLRGVRIGTAVAVLFSAACVTIRMFELTTSLNVRWDANAYGSAQWLVVGTHATLLIMQLVEMMGIAFVFWFGDVSGNHFSDADDAAFYWYFIVLIWVPLFVLSFLLPRT